MYNTLLTTGSIYDGTGFTGYNTGDPIIDYSSYYYYHPWQTFPYENKKIKKITKTIEKYNAKGKLVSREITITEEEIIDVPVWSSTITDGTTSNDFGNAYVNTDNPYTVTFDDSVTFGDISNLTTTNINHPNNKNWSHTNNNNTTSGYAAMSIV